MKLIGYSDIVTPELLEGNLDHNEYEGFLHDYRALHCLLRRFKPKTIFEIGTNIGSGVNVMATALPEAKIYSLDLDYETMRENSKQYPLEESGADRVGSAARFPYTQLRGDSLKFDYSKYYPIEAWFIDGEHDRRHAYHEARESIKSGAILIIFHDADMIPVNEGIRDAFNMPGGENYNLYSVNKTRIAFAVKNT
jgi:predicted O-methyltransferase YrrM